ncbi:hypothetical protein NDU88_006157 [Pleurodeles waltl]|uniref:Uncharacterized protein n=1 Tax=Pleurodeles waltl TaxID=8319 RepID=A0AAV7LU10_PLEWA|nr:hypothetical protein NDU88_006157 [Pleurodeles waltl]
MSPVADLQQHDTGSRVSAALPPLSSATLPRSITLRPSAKESLHPTTSRSPSYRLSKPATSQRIEKQSDVTPGESPRPPHHRSAPGRKRNCDAT